MDEEDSLYNFYCDACDYGTHKRSNFNLHLTTEKHKTAIATYRENENIFECECGKTYSYKQGLWRHRKKCNQHVGLPSEVQTDTDLVRYLMKENSEFKQLMLEQNKTIMSMAQNAGTNQSHNNNNNSNNSHNSFNLNFYLNETCKNAINLTDFVEQLTVTVADLEETGKRGFVDGISRIFINGLRRYGTNDRPIHCSDYKRETVYIKDQNVWSKDSEDKSMLTKAIRQVTRKNISKISEWTQLHPKFSNSSSKENDQYLKIVYESMSGKTDEEANHNYAQIARNIAKETVIHKK